MYKLPETVLVRPMMGTMPMEGDTHSSGPWALDNPYGNAVPFRRADLPPTPEQIAADPRVQKLVEALACVKVASNCSSSRDIARAALAEFTTTTTTKETT